MACFTNMHSDYPLILTLLGPVYRRALAWPYIATRPSAHQVPAPTWSSIIFCSSFSPIRMHSVDKQTHLGIDPSLCIRSRDPTSWRRAIGTFHRIPVGKSSRQH